MVQSGGFMTVGFIILLVALPVVFYRHWHGKNRDHDHHAAFWYRSEHFRRGHVRAIPTILFGGCCLAISALFLYLSPSDGISFRAQLAIVIFLALALLGGLLYWSVMLFAFPKFLIAPHLRSEKGVLQRRR